MALAEEQLDAVDVIRWFRRLLSRPRALEGQGATQSTLGAVSALHSAQSVPSRSSALAFAASQWGEVADWIEPSTPLCEDLRTAQSRPRLCREDPAQLLRALKDLQNAVTETPVPVPPARDPSVERALLSVGRCAYSLAYASPDLMGLPVALVTRLNEKLVGRGIQVEAHPARDHQKPPPNVKQVHGRYIRPLSFVMRGPWGLIDAEAEGRS